MDTSVFITNNSIIIDDTDSDTSSTSTADEFKEFTNEKKNETKRKSNILDKLIKPIQSHMYVDNETLQEIEDGFELSLLRLLHLWFSSDGVINFPNLTKYMDTNKAECKELEEFFIDNPGVMIDSDFYSSDAGIKIRKAWYKFLSDRDFFQYIHGTHQLVPDNSIFFTFIKQFFPLVNTNLNDNDQEKLNRIYSDFSFGDYKFKVIYSTYSQKDNQIIHKGFIHNIFVNDIELFVFESTQVRKLYYLYQLQIYNYLPTYYSTHHSWHRELCLFFSFFF